MRYRSSRLEHTIEVILTLLGNVLRPIVHMVFFATFEFIAIPTFHFSVKCVIVVVCYLDFSCLPIRFTSFTIFTIHSHFGDFSRLFFVFYLFFCCSAGAWCLACHLDNVAQATFASGNFLNVHDNGEKLPNQLTMLWPKRPTSTTTTTNLT